MRFALTATIVALLVAAAPASAAPLADHAKTLTVRKSLKWASPQTFAGGVQLSVKIRAGGRALRRRAGSGCKRRFAGRQLSVVVTLPCRRAGRVKLVAVSKRREPVRLALSYARQRKGGAPTGVDEPDEADEGDSPDRPEADENPLDDAFPDAEDAEDSPDAD